MENFRKTFFQLLLIILALAFTVCIRYMSDTDIPTGTFGTCKNNNVTLSDMLEKCVIREGGR